MKIGIDFAVLLLLFFAMLYTLLNRKYRKFYVPAKMLCSLHFLVTCILFGSMKMLPAFVLCFVGDLFMGLYNKTIKKKWLILGMLFFALAHVFFSIYFCTIKALSLVDFIFPVIGVAATFAVTKNKNFNFGHVAPLAPIYAFFVCFIASKCVSIFLSNMTVETVMLALGGIFFLASDTLIIPLYFKKKHGFTIHGWNLATYYLATFLLAVSYFFI